MEGTLITVRLFSRSNLYQACDLLQGESLFDVYSRESTEKNNTHHLAAMTALLGPPPPGFLQRSEETSRYWDNNGKCQPT